MGFVADNALLVQSDRSVLLFVDAPRADEARAALSPFAELVKSPEHVHTYRITPLTLWNARAAGLGVECLLDALRRHAKHPISESVGAEIEELGRRYGRTVIERAPDGGPGLVLRVADRGLAELIARDGRASPLLAERLSACAFRVEAAARGLLKQALVEAGYPAEDVAGYVAGDPLAVRLRAVARSGAAFAVRDYQHAAARAFHQGGAARGGCGVVVLPCGAGKTVVGLLAMAAVGESTLVLTTSRTSVEQWRREILDRTDVPAEAVAEYTADSKQTGPITLSTYQILTYRPSHEEDFPHLSLFRAREWGLIVYDEVHLLPAPVFRITAELQARRRLGLTATLVREDGREGDVFALIGPKRYDAPWRNLEDEGFIAAAQCTEIRVPLTGEPEMAYALAERRRRFRIAAENQRKREVVRTILAREKGSRILVLGEFLAQLEAISADTGLPLVTGATAHAERERLYTAFREGRLEGLVLSRVGNFALDLPDADVLVQVSGIHGSRQEEAQRLGRILRPKRDGRAARFYTLVSRRTCEEDYARHRQLFLTEQGYRYRIEIVGGSSGAAARVSRGGRVGRDRP